MILDNLSTHKTKLVEAFLDEHPNVTLHFTPIIRPAPNGSSGAFYAGALLGQGLRRPALAQDRVGGPGAVWGPVTVRSSASRSVLTPCR